MDICKLITSMDFDKNFINMGVNSNLDKYVQMLYNGENKLNAIRMYYDDLISKGEKKQKNDFIKIHETDKSGISLQCTSRRGVILKKY